ncbi:MAG TPA: hypothetical protein VML75_17930, partial [Kofleriaceae bacterium]|nr:hypothetical protein [Kofleriaceae bacterium]
MRRGVLLSILPSILALLLAVRSAAAQGIVVESYVGERPDDASDALRGLFQALATHGAVAGDALRDRLEASVSRPAAMVTDEHLATAARLVDQAEKLSAGGRHAEAIRVLPTA